MGFWDTAFNVIDAPSNALQGLTIDGPEGAWKGLTQQRNYDFEELLSDEFREEYPETAYWGSGVANFIVDPLNVVGLGLFKKGAQGTKAAVDAGATIGNKPMTPYSGRFVSSFDNYIDDWYGPGGEAKKASAKILALAKSKLGWLGLALYISSSN